jgi:hypothetical protein
MNNNRFDKSEFALPRLNGRLAHMIHRKLDSSGT